MDQDEPNETTELVAVLGGFGRLEVCPGDVFVLSCPVRLSAYERDNLRRQWESLFPNNKCRILEEGMTVGVIAQSGLSD